MKSLHYMSILFLVFIFTLAFHSGQAYAKPSNCSSVAQNLSICTANLNLCTADLGTCGGDLSICDASLTTCTGDLDTCTDDLVACEAQPCQTLPGDGYGNPDAFGVSGHGPALSYTDNGDGTFTDNNTGLMWEKKDDASSIHDKDNTYTWTNTGDGDSTNPDGTLFTVFLNGLNNTCDGAGVDACATDADCMSIGNEVCGFAGYQDWRIPNAKELQGIVDYSVANPASSVPGLTPAVNFWTATTDATPGLGGNKVGAFFVAFNTGAVIDISKFNSFRGRAVRP